MLRRKITVVGGREGGGSIGAALAAPDFAEVMVLGPRESFDDLAGSDIVVLAPGADVAASAGEVARRAPSAVVVVATEEVDADCEQAVEVSLLPRGRIVGVTEERAVREVVEAILFDRAQELPVVALCKDDEGLPNGVTHVTAAVGARGIVSLQPRRRA